MKKALIITLSAMVCSCSPAYAEDLFIFDVLKNPHVKTQQRTQKFLDQHKTHETNREMFFSRGARKSVPSKHRTTGRSAGNRVSNRVSSRRVE